jgi:phosphoribosylglycinamide formyltransferase-1
MIKLGVLISGSGTNLQAILDAISVGELDAEVALVISSRPDAYGLTRAAAANVPTVALSAAVYKEAWAADELIAEQLQAAAVDYVVLAGYMRRVRPELLKAFPGRVINLHPALLPSFPGAHAIADAFAFGVRVTGVTVHFVDELYDNGPIIAQEAVSIRPDDTLESLEARIHAVEHELLPRTLQLISAGQVHLDEGRVSISE